MPTQVPRNALEAVFFAEAQAYLRSLPLEHFMESIGQSTQRKITVESLDLVQERRPKVQVFSELLVQYRLPDEEKIRQIVPDNMVVIHNEPIEADVSFDLPLQPVRPFWVLEYVSKNSKRKDFETNLKKYEQELKVPYYLHFYPQVQELSLFHLKPRARRYKTVLPNERSRYAIPELDLELAILDGWVRYWYHGELLPLPGELQRQLDEARRQLREAVASARKQLAEAQQQLKEEQEARQALQREIERLRRRSG
ncbi:MAG TPA: Uma2 family endonuclease [Gemmataceae bacterium]|jgi:Uma2 family endonuclease|nr:Uma2 family endonuclease [Gemmataceae bacterium]